MFSPAASRRELFGAAKLRFIPLLPPGGAPIGLTKAGMPAVAEHHVCRAGLVYARSSPMTSFGGQLAMVHSPIPRSSVMSLWSAIRRFGGKEGRGRGQDGNGPVAHERLLSSAVGVL